MFPLPAVAGMLRKHYVEARLHFDKGPRQEENVELQLELGKSRANPIYVIYDPQTRQALHKKAGRLSEQELADLIFRYGEERHSRRIARAVVERRRERPFETAVDLAEVVRRVVPHSADARRIDPATRTFQALRIAVNDELGALETFLRDAPPRVRSGGRVGVISFHSLEDRIVKEAFRNDSRWTPLTKKPITATEPVASS